MCSFQFGFWFLVACLIRSLRPLRALRTSASRPWATALRLWKPAKGESLYPRLLVAFDRCCQCDMNRGLMWGSLVFLPPSSLWSIAEGLHSQPHGLASSQKKLGPAERLRVGAVECFWRSVGIDVQPFPSEQKHVYPQPGLVGLLRVFLQKYRRKCSPPGRDAYGLFAYSGDWDVRQAAWIWLLFGFGLYRHNFHQFICIYIYIYTYACTCVYISML